MAISSPISSLASAAKNTTKATIGLGRLLSRNIETKRNISTSTSIFRRRRVEIGKRSALRDKFLAPVLVTRQTGPRALALTSTSTSISDRLLGFIGYLSAGWILSNMPTWIALGKQFTSRIITAGRILSNYGDESLRVMGGITNVFRAALQNISSFDFTDSSYLVRSSLNDLKMEIDALGVGLKEAFDVLLQPFKDIPDLGTIQPDDPTQTPPPGTGLPDPKSAEMYRIAAALSTEGSGKQSVVDMMQVVVNRKAMGYGKTYTAILAGKGQFEGVEKKGVGGFLKIQTLEDASRWSGQSKNALLGIIKNIQDPALQANAAKHVGGALQFRGSPATVRAVNSDSNPNNNIQADANGRIPGSSWRGGNGDNQFITSNPAGAKYIPIRPGGAAAFNLPTPQAPTTQPPITGQRRLQKGDIFTKSLGKGVDYIEVSSLVGDGRNHGGIDIAAPSGTYIALRVDCEVVATGVYGNYGLLIDVWVPSLGIQLRMAHLSSVLIKSGKIPAGTSFARVGTSGRVTGPHIHLEYDTKRGTRGGGAINDDPNYAAKLDQYVRLLLLTRNKNKGQFTPAPTPMASLVPGTPSIPLSSEDQVEMQTNTYLSGLLDGITQERQGRKIVIIDDRSSVVSQQIVSSSGGDDLQIQIPDSVLLNNFIKNKLLLDLNYL